MSVVRRFRAAALTVALVTCLSAVAAAPRLIPFQGVARTAAGAPVPSPMNVEVTLFDAAAAGAVRFGPENHVGVPVTSTGGFSILIGSNTAGGVPNSALDPAEVWVGIRINGDPEMTPRVHLASVPYAFRVDRVASPELDDSIDLGTPGISGLLQVFRSGAASPTVKIQGVDSSISLYDSTGASRKAVFYSPSWGELQLYDYTGGNLTVDLGASSNSGGYLSLRDSDGIQTMRLEAGVAGSTTAINLFPTTGGAAPVAKLSRAGQGGLLECWDPTGTTKWVYIGAYGSGGGGLYLYQKDGKIGMNVDGDSGGANGGGLVQVYAGDGSASVVLDGDYGGAGYLSLRNSAGTERIALDGEGYANGGSLNMRSASGGVAATIDSNNGTGGGGYLSIANAAGTTRAAELYDETSGGRLNLYQKNGTQTVVLDADAGNNNTGSFMWLYGAGGTGGLYLDGDQSGSGGGGYLSLYQANGSIGAAFDADANGANGGANIVFYAGDGSTTLRLDADAGDGAGTLSIANDVSETRIFMDGKTAAGGGAIGMYDTTGTNTIFIDAAQTTTEGARIDLKKADGTTTIILDAEFGGDGRIITQELQITGGSDLSEQFSVRGSARPGMVVCIDPSRAGHLMVSSRAYDRTVAGVMSGAGGIKPGMMMGQAGTRADGGHAVALTGRVYVWCDARYGSIRPGDLLTTSHTPGHAMVVKNHAKAQGAILGKAMTSLKSGKGLVLALVTLQ